MLLQTVQGDFPNNKRVKQVLAQLGGGKLPPASIKHPPNDQLDMLIAGFNQRHFSDVIEQAEKLSAAYPTSFVLWNIIGAAAAETDQTDKALTAFRKVLQIVPDQADAHSNIGNVLKKQGHFEEAIAAFERALTLKPDLTEAHNNLGGALLGQGKLDKAIACFHRALALQPDYVFALNNLANALREQGNLEQAIACAQKAIRLKPDYADAHNSLGVALKEFGALEDAVTTFQTALKLQPDYPHALNNMASALQDLGRLDEAIDAYEQALNLAPDYETAEVQMLHQKQHICDFSNHMLERASARLGIKTKAVLPFATLSWADDPEQQFIRSRKWAAEKYNLGEAGKTSASKPRNGRIRIGYFSADFHDHATMYLMAGLLRSHDHNQFEVSAYSYGRIKTGVWRDRAKQDVDHFFDVADLSDQEIADLARDHHLDIAIDLKGYTQQTRSRIFQYRLAPVQINYLGFPGTMGADFIDYIVADPVVISTGSRPFFSEKVIRMPDSYLPNDDTREIAKTETTRADFGLPETGFVFCSFNGNYKISPREFDIWMRLLGKVDGSVLWLFRSNKWAETNLKKEAKNRGVDPSRLIFAESLPHADHLARHKHADLFIDTFNYNAHTTASDALWAGLPVITKIGRQFSARVAASLLTAVGLPELITESEVDYERLILELATSPEKLAAIKSKLAANRLSTALFDTKRYTRDFEACLRRAYERHAEGLPPEDITI